MPIQILSDQIIGQIAAGEVVERPASVVKELLENALDAGASNIHISVNGGGRKLIRISDNGTGIRADEVKLAFTRHATSKLHTIDDLYTLVTLGFRGEALASIASVSRTSVTTRHHQEEMGTQLHIEGGEIIRQQATGAPSGTVIAVENLFFNTPARLKFMKKETTEKRHISSIVTHYAMAYPEVRFTLEQDGRESFRSNGSGALIDVLVQAMGLDNVRQMIEVTANEFSHRDQPPATVSGYISTPEYHRSDRNSITLFVNGRWIQDSRLTYAITQAYHGYLNDGRYPVAVLMLDVPTQEVDVNVHPTKAEVRFRDASGVFSAVQRAVRQAVLAADQQARQHQAIDDGFGGVPVRRGADQWHENNPDTQLDMGLQVDAVTNHPQSYSAYSDDPTAIPEGPGRPLKPRTLPMLRVVGQVGAMYIVAEGPAGMYLIDQHTAHTRVLYESLLEAYQQGQAVVQHTLSGISVDLKPTEMRSLEDHAALLHQLGIELEKFGPGTMLLRALPAMVIQMVIQNEGQAVHLLRSITEKLSQKDHLEQVVHCLSTFAAYKTGQILSHDEMQGLIRELERCAEPRTSPDGRPTLLHMSSDQLARQFGKA